MTYSLEVDIYRIAGRHHYNAFKAVIPGDFSSASSLIAASVLLPGRVTLRGLDWYDSQGDKQLISWLQAMGANIRIASDAIVIEGGQPLQGMTIDARDTPDLLPVLAVIGSQAAGVTRLIHVPHARIKETDRIHSMTAGLRQLSAQIEAHADGLTVWSSRLHGAHVKGYGDHRTVMALTVAGLVAQGTTVISDAHAIQKTYPTFVEHLQSLGAHVVMRHDS